MTKAEMIETTFKYAKRKWDSVNRNRKIHGEEHPYFKEANHELVTLLILMNKLGIHDDFIQWKVEIENA